MTISRSSLTSASAAMVLVAFLWGGGFTASKAAVSDVPPLSSGLLRYGLALLILVPLYMRERKALPPERYTRATWIALIGLGLTAVTGYNALFFWGLTLAPSSDSILMIPTTTPIWTAIIATAFIGERAGPRLTFGMLVALLGMALALLGGHTGEFDQDRLYGNILFILGAAVFGTSHVISRFVTRQISPIGATTMAGIIGALALLPLAIIEGGLREIPAAPLQYWLIMLFIAFGVTALGYVLFYRSVTRVGPGRASFYTNLVPVFGLSLSALFLDEIPTPLQVIGGAIMLGAVLWVSLERGTVSAESRPVDSRSEQV